MSLDEAAESSRVEYMPGICAVEDCDREARSRGWCQMHYKRWWKTGTVEFDHGPDLQPSHGPYGDLEFDTEGKAICHFCGVGFELVGVHSLQAHGINSDEYRERCGLSEQFPLCSARFAEVHRRALKKRRDEGDPTLMDPEEIRDKALRGSQAKRGQPHRASAQAAITEGIRSYWSDQTNRHPSPVKERSATATEGIECVNCGTLFTPIDPIEQPTGRILWAAAKRKTCSIECRRRHFESRGLALGDNGKARFTTESQRQDYAQKGREKGLATRRRQSAAKREATPHGTRNKYRYGCRCDPCRAANAQHSREMRERRQAGQ